MSAHAMPSLFLAGRRTTHGTCGAAQSPQRRGTWHTLARGDECARAIHHQCGVAQLAARRAHNPEVVRSSRTAATKQRESSTEGSAVDGMPATAMCDSGRHERQAAARLRLGDKGTCAMPLVLRIARIKPGLSHPRTSVAISAYCAAMHRRPRALEWA